jgi:hypothetical protein
LTRKALFEFGKVRLFGDLVVAAFFEGKKPKEREEKRNEYASAILSGGADGYCGWLEECRHRTEQPLVPFHWDIEFPEVFDRKNAGFDAFVGNPPFMGGVKISGPDWSPPIRLGKGTLESRGSRESSPKEPSCSRPAEGSDPRRESPNLSSDLGEVTTDGNSAPLLARFSCNKAETLSGAPETYNQLRLIHYGVQRSLPTIAASFFVRRRIQPKW